VLFRSVLAVPGPISNPYSVACHVLIKEGAHLISSVEDFYQALNLIQPEKQVELTEPLVSGKTAKKQAPIQQIAVQQAGNKQAVIQQVGLSEQEAELLAILRNQGTALSFDQLALSSHYHSGQLAECLLKLQIKQIIEQQGQNYILKT